MKKIILLIGILFCNHVARSQVLISLLLGDKLNTGQIEFGLDGGLNLSGLKGAEGAKTTSLFNLGFYFDFRLKNPAWMFHTGVIVKSVMGAKGIPVYSLQNSQLDSLFINGSVERRINYFNVPFMMKYKLTKAFFAEGGTMLGLRIKSYDVFTQSVNNKDDLTHEVEISDQLQRIDAGIIAGIGYRLMGGNGMNIGIRYYLGLVNTWTDKSLPGQYNETMYFNIGIPIGAGKAKKEREAKEEKK